MKKELSEMFALGAITLTQLIQGCDSFKDLKESLEYAEDYGKAYDRWCHSMQQKEEEKESSWKEFTAHYEDIDLMFEQMDRMWRCREAELDYEYEEGYADACELMDNLYDYDCTEISHYSEHELQEAYDLWYNDKKDRKKDIRRIAKEAKSKSVSYSTIYKFMQEYSLTDAERTVFWLAFYE